MRGMWPFRKKSSEPSASKAGAGAAGWTLSISQGLSAHMNQPAGPSRPAMMWMMSASDGITQKKLTVQDYMDAPGGRTQEESAAAAIRFVGDLIRTGWSPNDYQGEPGELIVPIARSK
jgi:hypothetical protein